MPSMLSPNYNNHHKTHQPKPNKNILQLNINGLPRISKEVENFLNHHSIHIALIQEPYQPAYQPSPTFYKYDSILSVHNQQNHTLLSLIHNSLTCTNTTTQISNSPNANTRKLQSFSVIINKTSHNIINL